MRRYLMILAALLITAQGFAQEQWDDESMQKQLQAMELGDIEFTPKEYYRILHGKPEPLNFGLGDSYSVYDHEWQWGGIHHTGMRWNFKPNKSIAKNVFPKRVEYTAADSITAWFSEEMMDTLAHQATREIGRAADCTLDLYYDAYSDLFDKYDKNITDNLSSYLVSSGKMVDGTFVVGDKMGIKDKTILELNKLREMVANTHSAYMESTLKEEIYSMLLQDYKKLNKMVLLHRKVVE